MTAQVTCLSCTLKEPAPVQIRRCAGELYFCPIHAVYVRPDEPKCSHYEPYGKGDRIDQYC